MNKLILTLIPIITSLCSYGSVANIFTDDTGVTADKESIIPLDYGTILMHNLAIDLVSNPHSYTPQFVVIPGYNHSCPSGSLYEVESTVQNDVTICTQMLINKDWNRFCLYSIDTHDTPIILISALQTDIDIRCLPYHFTNYEPSTIKLWSIYVPDGNDRWQPASKKDKDFYSYHYNREWFHLTFPENKTDEFRCLLMTIAINKEDKEPVGEPPRLSRTWLFIQLPWTDNPDIFNHIPYRDFTLYYTKNHMRTYRFK